MKRAVIILLCIALASAAGIYYRWRHDAQAGMFPGLTPDLISQLPPGAPAIGYVDVATLRASAFFEQIVAGLPPAEQGPEYTEFARTTGFDYARDLDRLAVAAWPGSPSPSVVVLAEGRFDRDRIRRYALRFGKASNGSGGEIYDVRVNSSAKAISFAFMTSNRIALASGTSLTTVLMPSATGHADLVLSQRIKQVAGASLFGGARTQDLPKELSLDTVQSDQLSRLLRSVQFITLVGRPDGERFDMALDAECDSRTNAFQLAALLDGLRWLGRAGLADPKTRQRLDPRAAALFDGLLRMVNVSHQDKQVQLRLALTPGMLAPVLRSPNAKVR